ncbi:MAG: ATP-binding protein [Acidobacteriota bacterium]
MPRPTPQIEILGPDGPLKSVPVGKSPFVIGSATTCDLQLKGHGVHPRHAQIVLLGGAYVLLPLASAGRPRVEGNLVGEVGTSLRSGALIDLTGSGTVRLRIQMPSAKKEPGGERLLTLMEVARTITSSLDLDEILERVLEGAVRFSGAERGYLFLKDGERLVPWSRDANPPTEIEVSRSIVEEVAGTGRPVYRDRIGGHGGRSVTESIVRLRLQAILCLPLTVRSDIIGVVYLDSRRHLPHHEPDLPLLEALAGLAAVAIQNSRLVDERVRAERTLAIGQMARAIVHDLRSPLTSIRGLAELMYTRSSAEDASRPHLQTIISEVDRLTHLTGDLLQFSKAAPPLEILEVKMADLVRQTLRPLEQRLVRSRVELELALDEEARVRVDPARMVRVLHNLIANALEAMPDGGRLAVRCMRSEAHCATSLTDSGRGIPEEIRKRLFEPFATHGKKQGTGLGLAIVRKIVEEHGGAIRIENASGGGTRVELDLPIAA